MAPHLGLVFFSGDQGQLGKDLLIVYAKCLFLVGVLYFISLFRFSLNEKTSLFSFSSVPWEGHSILAIPDQVLNRTETDPV